MTCCPDDLRSDTVLCPNLLGPLSQSTKIEILPSIYQGRIYLAHLLLLPQDLLSGRVPPVVTQTF